MLSGLRAIETRDEQRRSLEGAVERAGVNLSPTATWLLLRIERDRTIDPMTLSREHRVSLERIQSGLSELRSRDLVAETRDNGGGPRVTLTQAGCDVLDRLLESHAEAV